MKKTIDDSENESTRRERVLTAIFKDYENAHTAYRMLQAKGYDILLAMSGQTCKQIWLDTYKENLVNEENPELAISKWNLPGEYLKSLKDGIEKGMIVLGIFPKNYADAEFIEKMWRSFKGDVQYC